MKEKIINFTQENKYWLCIIGCLILIILGIIIFSIYIYQNKSVKCSDDKLSYNVDFAEKNLDETVDENENELKENKCLYVDIKGSIEKPGVYCFDEETIVNDAIVAAGGFNDDAILNNINLSKKIENEMVIYVFSKSEIKEVQKYEFTEQAKNDSVVKTEDIYIDKSIKEKDSIIDDSCLEQSNGKSDENIVLVNINTASLDELMSLNGIGESKAKDIIAYREQSVFKTIEDLKNVSGIGDSTFESIKNFITI